VITLGEFSLDEVLPFTNYTQPVEREYICDDVPYKPRMRSNRYHCFRRKGVACVTCGIVGVKFLLQMCEGDQRPHFNLYAEKDGKLILMTKDHIYPKSKGGSNGLSNLQTMCSPCNCKKADKTDGL
jgi:5-methylcytosine-specific restriction endonuclease McrA